MGVGTYVKVHCEHVTAYSRIVYCIIAMVNAAADPGRAQGAHSSPFFAKILLKTWWMWTKSSPLQLSTSRLAVEFTFG